ncbi:MAG: 23S rRNA (pseudouridine(1915)-N(3))-methyltransferase RlmH [Muribaculaceae bacterium]|nr:23S rRNA (pseudouridine(1915)-N(3))-methyltransferase RlmH [Muribaculaceae bacterium]
MDIYIVSIGKVTAGWISQGIDEYEKRIVKYIKFYSKILPDVTKSKIPVPLRVKEEGKLFLNEISGSDFVVLLDEKGVEFTSEQFSGWLEKMMVSGKKRLLFLIGGPYGFSDEIYKRKDAMLSLSKMTFTHEMAKLFATEQIYRGLSILRGDPYHHN